MNPILSILLTGWTLWVHPLHVSVTEIEMKEEPREMQVTMRVYVDDLETALRIARHEPELDITRPTKGKGTDELIGSYLQPAFSVSLDGKEKGWKYLGSEIDGDVFYLYLLISDVPPWKTITVRNTIIMNAYDDQSNIVNVSVRDKVRSLRLTNLVTSGKLEF